MEAKIIERIRKLLALANDKGASENEAAIAMRRASVLLATHNLTPEDVAKGSAEEVIDRHSFMYGGNGNQNRSGPWARYIARAIGELNFCSYYFNAMGHKDKHTFIGKATNAAVAQMVTEYVLRSINTEAVAGAKLNKHDSNWLNAFRNAAATRIHYRCKALIKEMQEQGNEAGTGLVLASLFQREAQAIEVWKANSGLALRASKGGARRATSADAVQAGKAAGERVAIRPQASQQQHRALGHG